MTRDELIEKLTNATDDGTSEVSVLDESSTGFESEIIGLKGEVETDGTTKLYIVVGME